MSGAHRSEQDLPQGFLAPVQVYLVESLLRNLLPASLGCPSPSALGPGAAQPLSTAQCCAGFCSQGSAVGCGLHLEEGQPHLSLSCMYSANAKVEFSISVWMGGLALFPPALPWQSWRCFPPPSPPVQELSERGHRSRQAPSSSYPLDFPFSALLSCGIDMAETFLTLGWANPQAAPSSLSPA